jgi:hypothetical protein
MVVSIIYEHKKMPVIFIGVGGSRDGLGPFGPATCAGARMGMDRQAEDSPARTGART